MNQGIFEIYKKSDGEYDTHGMITSNTELDILDGCNNFHDIAHITKGEWTYFEDTDSYKLKTSLAYGVLEYTGYFASGDKNYIESVILSRVKEHEYNIDVKYKLDAKLEGKKDYTIHFDHFNENSNQKLKDFAKNKMVTTQNDWNEYQSKALTTYGFVGAPYLHSFTIGMKLHFVSISGYASGGYALIVYDCMSNAQKENDFKEELLGLGFTQKGLKSFYKPSSGGLNLNIQYAFIPHSEIETMVAHGEASSGDLLAYPNGYMQVLYAYSFGEEDLTFDELNVTLTQSMLLPSIGMSTVVNKLTKIDYKDSFNYEATHDEEFLKVFEELEVEPGPIYDEIASIYFYIEDEADAISYVEAYRSLIANTDYILNGEEGKSISEMDGRCAEYYLLNESDLAQHVLDIYLYDSSQSGDYEWTGVVEMVITKYTDLGLLFYFGA